MPLDIIVVRKLGVPFQPELAMGAIGEGGVRILNDRVVRLTGVTAAEIAEVQMREEAELARRAGRFRGTRQRVSLAGRIALIVDDGIATGATVRAACKVARAQGAGRVVVAEPVAPPDAVASLHNDADDVIALSRPGSSSASVSSTTTSRRPRTRKSYGSSRRVAGTPRPVGRASSNTPDPPDRDEEVDVHAGAATVSGHLTVPDGRPRSSCSRTAAAAAGTARATGSSRPSSTAGPRDAPVRPAHAHRGTRPRERVRHPLARRAASWTSLVGCAHSPKGDDAAIGYFGASTGAGAALWAAAEPDAEVQAVVSRGGRPDLAGPRLADVRAPTLLIVGGDDPLVVELNREAQARMRCENRLAVVPGASHLFEEPGHSSRPQPAGRRLAAQPSAPHLPGGPNDRGPAQTVLGLMPSH